MAPPVDPTAELQLQLGPYFRVEQLAVWKRVLFATAAPSFPKSVALTANGSQFVGFRVKFGRFEAHPYVPRTQWNSFDDLGIGSVARGPGPFPRRD